MYPLEYLDIPEKKIKQFHKKKINSIDDLFHFFPIHYYDYSKDTGLEGERVSIVLTVYDVKSGVSKNNVHYIIARGNYKGKNVSVMWFRSQYLLADIYLTINKKVLVAGKLNTDNGYTIFAPDIYSTDIKWGIYPVYSKIAGMSDDYLKECIKKAFSLFPITNHSCLPLYAEKLFSLVSYETAILNLHYPQKMEDVERSKMRLIYDDLYHFALIMAREEKRKNEKSFVKIKKDNLFQSVLINLPFKLTADQNETVSHIVSDIKNGNRINCLVQGDVGCGKTIVAILTILLLADNNYQSVLIAPTSVLAKQHYSDLTKMLEGYGIDVLYVPPLSGMRKKEKQEILEQIKSGHAKILVGTHSLLSDEIEFHKLGLIITDEEHRFGVEQREKLLRNTEDGVHYITMSATPIPRSLANVIYGESMNIHLIQTMPEGRKPVQTAINSNWNTCINFIDKQINNNRQIYVVCPMIDSNEKMEGVMSVSELKKKYEEIFGIDKVSVLTGRNSKKETEEILTDFKNNEKQILIATTVIEVGVNVPNANTIIIHNAERFGLAELHQLRGRVGRGGGDAYCILFSEDKENERLHVMCKTNNGFEIAEADLELRGAGELLGTEQSGISKYTGKVIQYPDDYKKVLAYVKHYL